MEEQGVKVPKADNESGTPDSPTPSEKAGKPSKLGKLKDKLHLKHKDKSAA